MGDVHEVHQKRKYYYIITLHYDLMGTAELRMGDVHELINEYSMVYTIL